MRNFTKANRYREANVLAGRGAGREEKQRRGMKTRRGD
jgi:hypothetical protein